MRTSPRPVGIVIASALALAGLAGPPVLRADPAEAAPAEEEFLRRDIPEETRRRIDGMVGRGLAWLAANTEAALDRYTLEQPVHADGPLALRALALAKCGREEDHRELIERCLDALRKHHGRQEQFAGTYAVAVNLMAIEAYLRRFGPGRGRAENREDLEWAARLAFWLASGSQEGGWGYGCPGYGPEEEGETTRAGRIRGATPDTEGPIRFRPPPRIPAFRPLRGGLGRTDNSNSQYAVLGLKGASRLGIEFPRRTWEEIARFWMRTQQEEGRAIRLSAGREAFVGAGDGTHEGASTLSGIDSQRSARGWEYKPDPAADGSAGPSGGGTFGMTGAGITALCIALSEMEDGATARRAEEALWDGWAWMQNYLVHRGPRPVSRFETHYHYALYGLERAGVFSRVRTIGERDWYIEGVEALAELQNEDGSWGGAAAVALPGVGRRPPAGRHPPSDPRSGPHVNTCFALLFLKRASAGFLDAYPVGPGD